MGEERFFSQDVRINKNKLDEECEKHSSVYYYWAEKAANTKTELGKAEDLLKFITAETDLETRKDWNDTKYGKMTEASIKSVLEIHPKIKKQKEVIQDLQGEVNRLTAAVSAMEHRKSELNNLTSLLISGFYSSPKGIQKEEVTEKTGKDIKKRMNKKEDD
jgi:hypothetical protein